MITDNIRLGKYVAAMYISDAVEEREIDGKHTISGYLGVSVGGRRGAFDIKYDPDDPDFKDFISGLSVGDEILCGVDINTYKDSVYYKLKSLQYLRKPEKVSGASAVDKLEASIKSGGGKP